MISISIEDISIVHYYILSPLIIYNVDHVNIIDYVNITNYVNMF